MPCNQISEFSLEFTVGEAYCDYGCQDKHFGVDWQRCDIWMGSNGKYPPENEYWDVQNDFVWESQPYINNNRPCNQIRDCYNWTNTDTCQWNSTTNECTGNAFPTGSNLNWYQDLPQCQTSYTTYSRQKWGTLEYSISEPRYQFYPSLNLDVTDMYQNQYCNWKLVPNNTRDKVYLEARLNYDDSVEKIYISSTSGTVSKNLPLSGESFEVYSSDEIMISYLTESPQSYSQFNISYEYLGTREPQGSYYDKGGVNLILVVLFISLLLFALILVIALLVCKYYRNRKKPVKQKKVKIFSDQPVLYDSVIRQNPNRMSIYRTNTQSKSYYK